MNPFTKGAKVRAVRDTKSYGVGTPIPEGAVLEVARTNEVDAAQLFNAIRPDGGEYALAKADFEPSDATPAPLDPSKVRAGDTVTLLVDPPDTHPAFTVAGETHSLGSPTVYLGGWRVDDLPDYVTLTDHQPATEPEWKPGTTGTATVMSGDAERAARTFRKARGTWVASHAGVRWFVTHEAAIPAGNLVPEEDVRGFVPDEPRPLPTREQRAQVVDLLIAFSNDRADEWDTADEILALLRGESR